MRTILQIIISNGILDLVTGILAKISLGTGIWAKFRLGTGIWHPPSRPSGYENFELNWFQGLPKSLAIPFSQVNADSFRVNIQ